MRRRTLLRSGAIGAGAVALGACAGTLPRTDTTVDGFGENATGTVRVWCRAATQDPITASAAEFNAAQDDLSIVVTPIPDAQYVTKLATSIRGGTVPDLVDFDLINCPLFIVRDAFADLTEQVQALDITDVLSPGHLGEVTYEDRYFGVPYLGDYSTLWFNTELMGQADLDPQESAQSLETLLEACRQIRRALPDVTPWSFPGNSPGALGFTVQPMVWATGRDLITPSLEDQRGDIVGNEAVESVLEFHRQLWVDELVSRRAYADDASQWGADFRTGQVAMVPGSYGMAVSDAEESMREKMVNVLLPGPEGGRSTFSGGDNLCILNGSPNPSGAWQFCRYLIEVAQQERMPEGGYLPIRADAATDRFREDFPHAVPPIEDIDAGYVPFTLGYNFIYNQPAGPWLAMFRQAVFDGDIAGAM
ncbi:MAG: extracellular solute-binding protein, partial [Brachybacterium sp.]|nr:extracellular solute-binding protein [Brachybacterium sp.]